MLDGGTFERVDDGWWRMNTSIGPAPESTAELRVADLCERVDTFRERSGDLCVIVLAVEDVATIRKLHGDQTADDLVECIRDRVCVRTRGTDLVVAVSDDEFIVVLTAITAPGDATFVAAKICHQIGEPMTASGREIHMTAHTGIAVAGAGDSGADLIARARRDALRVATSDS